MGFGFSLRAATSNLPSSPNPISNRDVLHDGRKHTRPSSFHNPTLSANKHVIQICCSSLSAAVQTVQVERRTSPFNGIERLLSRVVVIKTKSLPVSATTFPTALSLYIAHDGRKHKHNPKLSANHGDLTLALTRCSCSALREVAVFVRECGKCKPLYASVIERCVTLPVGTWSVARKQSLRFVGGHMHNVATSHFERKETKFGSNKTAIYRRNRSSVCLLFVKLALLCIFSSSIRPITYTRASREHALDASGSAKP